MHLPALLALLLCSPISPQDQDTSAGEVTLERIFSDPEWIGSLPERPFWAGPDTIGFWRERPGQALDDLWAAEAAAGEPQAVELGAWRSLWRAGGDWDAANQRYVYAADGDLYLAALEGPATPRQLTRTRERESAPRFLLDGERLAFERGGNTFLLHLSTGFVDEPFELATTDDPGEDGDYSYLEAKHERLYDKIAEDDLREEERRARNRDLAAEDGSRPPLPFYLGKGSEVRQSSLAPRGDFVLVALRDEYKPAARGTMPNYVTDSGKVETRDVRQRVGNAPPAERLALLDLRTHTRHDLETTGLPGIDADPFTELRAQALEWHVAHGAEKEAFEKKLKAPEKRALAFQGVRWSPNGERGLVRLDALDNKDTWYALVDLAAETPSLEPLHRITDEAWINDHVWPFGWIDDDEVWYLSEETGYAQLHARAVDGSGARALTSGEFVVRSPVVDALRKSILFLANEGDPSHWDVQRVDLDTGERVRLTSAGRIDAFALSPGERWLMTTRSSMGRPGELSVQPYGAAGSAGAVTEARQVTQTTSEAFDAIDWTLPELVDVPSTHVDRAIRARLYRPVAPSPLASGKRPAVLFVHGAGYLQNAKATWSGYFREFFFHTFLTRQGIVVLDLDYRGSANYGRDWRTAIYRQMGHPELEDLQDGVRWLAQNENVDPERIGVYGGSYGGFMAFMALFRDPQLFACGAALRPVTDWAHYNHGYTSNILNTPLLDPMAFEKSSPIEYAAGLERPLLIASGMQDNNVFFQDTVLLVQRLIELKKEDFETAIYPLDPHAFRHAESWLDEYRRIWKLFEQHLLP